MTECVQIGYDIFKHHQNKMHMDKTCMIGFRWKKLSQYTSYASDTWCSYTCWRH